MLWRSVQAQQIFSKRSGSVQHFSGRLSTSSVRQSSPHTTTGIAVAYGEVVLQILLQTRKKFKQKRGKGSAKIVENICVYSRNKIYKQKGKYLTGCLLEHISQDLNPFFPIFPLFVNKKRNLLQYTSPNATAVQRCKQRGSPFSRYLPSSRKMSRRPRPL